MVNRSETEREPTPSVSQLIQRMKESDEVAQTQLWNHYFQKLVNLAQIRLRQRGVRRRESDEEDIVISIFDSVFDRAGRGQFPDLHCESDLWWLLVTVMERKVLNEVRRQSAQKRGGRKIRGESVFTFHESGPAGLNQIAGISPSQGEVDVLVNSLEELLDTVGEELAAIARLRLEGYSNEEIAGQLGCSVATVERRLKLLRRRLSGQICE